MQLDRILYDTLSSEIGRKFLRYSLGLLGFGNIVITPCCCVIDNSPLSYPQFKERIKNLPMSFQKNLKNSDV